ncbi:MAG: dodecin family protein [Elainellaceae cyanobacterium]
MAVAKVIEIVSSSEKSFDDAVHQGLAEAGKTLHGISGLEIKSWTADVENNQAVRYKVTMHLAFKVEHAAP